MTKIYTKTGDDGTTALFGGTRVTKSDLRIEAYGAVDEVNSWIGLILSDWDKLKRSAECQRQFLFLKEIQNRLFDVGSHLATVNPELRQKLPELDNSDVTLIEKEIDQMNLGLKPLTQFIVPGGHPLSAKTQILRTVIRRAERHCVRLSQNDSVDLLILQLLNRLSDYAFTLARFINSEYGVGDSLWIKR